MFFKMHTKQVFLTFFGIPETGLLATKFLFRDNFTMDTFAIIILKKKYIYIYGLRITFRPLESAFFSYLIFRLVSH